MLRLLLITLLALPTGIRAAERSWRFGDSPAIEPEEIIWSEISVLRRRPHLARRVNERVVFEGAWLPTKARAVRAGSPLLVEPEKLADLRSGRSWDPVLDRYGFWDAATLECGLPGLGKPEASDSVAVMFCTVYYTPLESGFTAERGFNMTPETRTGLAGKKYAHDFLRAVIVEGFGRLKTPVGGKNYIKYDGRWGYCDRILGNRNNTLVDRESAAVHRRNKMFSKNTRLRIIDPDVFAALGSLEWRVADTGGGLHQWQVDLYWGEDIPLGTGFDRFRPMGCPLAKKSWLPVAVSKP